MFCLHQDQAAARATQRLVRGAGDDIGNAHRIRVQTGSDQAGVMRHVHHEIGADILGDFREALEVDAQRIGRRAGQDQLGLLFMRQSFDLVVIDFFLVVQAIALDVEPFAAHVHR